MASKKRCVRCESLERKQKTRQVIYTGPIPVCLVCMQEIAEMESFFKKELEEEDEFGSEVFDSESC
jgi:hypothetical protein